MRTTREHTGDSTSGRKPLRQATFTRPTGLECLGRPHADTSTEKFSRQRTGTAIDAVK